MPPETTKEQFRIMLQNLMGERFKLTIHRETKELPTYVLMVAKNGPKLTESTPPPESKDDPDAPPPSLPSQPKIGPDGFPDLPASLLGGGRGGLFNIMMPGRARMIARLQTMQDLATRLSNQLSRPVTDATGLTAKYDFTLTFAPEGMNGPMGPIGPPPGVPPPGAGAAPLPNQPEAETPPDIFRALQSQLGLRLEPKKAPAELIVIDHIEKTPTEN